MYIWDSVSWVFPVHKWKWDAWLQFQAWNAKWANEINGNEIETVVKNQSIHAFIVAHVTHKGGCLPSHRVCQWFKVGHDHFHVLHDCHYILFYFISYNFLSYYKALK